MKHCGMDVHVKSTTVETLDATTGEVERKQVRTDRETLRRWLQNEPRMQVVLEAGTVSHWVADVVEAAGHDVIVVDPNHTKAIAVAGGHKKTDRLDAATLAWLSSKGAVKASHRPTVETRARRQELVLRQRIVRSRADLVRAVRSAMHADGMSLSGKRRQGFPDQVREKLGGVEQESALAGALRSIEQLHDEAARLDAVLEQRSKDDEVVRRLMTVPGVGPVVANAYRVVIEDPSRFRHGRQVAAYLGLVPSVRQSGEATARLGSISKHGDKMMRSLLVEAAHSLLWRCRRPCELQAWGRALALRIGKRKAAVAVARKLAVMLWAIWKKGTTFHPTILSSSSQTH